VARPSRDLIEVHVSMLYSATCVRMDYSPVVNEVHQGDYRRWKGAFAGAARCPPPRSGPHQRA
ncbi:MAG TPA: hypothetical protein VF788_04570, partial [Pseudonocardiaceae bacterium]